MHLLLFGITIVIYYFYGLIPIVGGLPGALVILEDHVVRQYMGLRLDGASMVLMESLSLRIVWWLSAVWSMILIIIVF